MESVAAGPSITSWYREHGGDGSVTDLRDVAARAAAGESAAREALAGGGRGFGRALASLANVIDPEAFMVGGGVAEVGPAFWLPMEEALRAELMPAATSVSVHRAMLGGDAAVIGAAALLFADSIARTPADTPTERKDGTGR